MTFLSETWIHVFMPGKGLVTLKHVALSDVIWNKFHASHWLIGKRKERVPMGGIKLISNDI